MTDSQYRRFSRRQMLSSALGTAGLLGLAQLGRTANAADPDSSVVQDLFDTGDSKIPFIGLTEDGPLYPPGGIDWLSDLTGSNTANQRAEGKILYLFGRVLDSRGFPLRDASVEIWQTDFNGNYRHPRGWNQDRLDPNFGYFGKVRTDPEGFYLFKTIRPRWYSLFGTPRAAHIHLKMRHMDHGVLTTETYFENASHEEIAPKDSVFLSRPKWVRDRIVLPEESPNKYRDLNIAFENDAICCQYDLAFLL
jgi:protocatechuate 3,4-dioxygenase beta subunit